MSNWTDNQINLAKNVKTLMYCILLGGGDFREAWTSYLLNNKVIFGLVIAIMISQSFKIEMTTVFTLCAKI